MFLLPPGKWAILMPPTKYPASIQETKWSKRLESVRKDVECFFGILKGRFRILKLPILHRKQEDVDNILFTCCTLHNMLHLCDGLDVLEANTNWGGSAGCHDPKYHNPLTDYSSVGSRDKCDEVEVDTEHSVLKSKLVNHFAYRHKVDDIVWLSR